MLEVALLPMEVPYIARSLPTGTCWPLVGDVIFTFDMCCWDDVDVVLFPTAAVLFCAEASTLLQRVKIKIPKAQNRARFHFPILTEIYIKYIKRLA